MVGYLTAGCHARKPRAYAVALEHGAVFHRYPAYFDWHPLSAVRHVVCRHDESPRAAMRRVANDRAAAASGAKGFTSWSGRTPLPVQENGWFPSRPAIPRKSPWHTGSRQLSAGRISEQAAEEPPRPGP